MSRIDFKKNDKLNFKYNILDILELNDGQKIIITDYGIYDNQYMCDPFYGDECRLAGAKWIYKDDISHKIQDIEDIKKYTNIFMETLIEVCQRHQTSIYIDDIKYIEKYLAELENGGN